MTPESPLDKLSKLHAASTQGEWEWIQTQVSNLRFLADALVGINPDEPVIEAGIAGGGPEEPPEPVLVVRSDSDAEWIAESHNLFSALKEQFEALEKEVERLKAKFVAYSEGINAQVDRAEKAEADNAALRSQVERLEAEKLELIKACQRLAHQIRQPGTITESDLDAILQAADLELVMEALNLIEQREAALAESQGKPSD